MRCNRRLLLKIPSCLLLTTVLTSLIVLVTFVGRHPRPWRTPHYNLDDVQRGAASIRPGAFLAAATPRNDSFCTFQYELPARFRYDESDLAYSPQLAGKSPYRVLYNVVGGVQPPPSVTFATHVTPEYIDYVPEIARAWDGVVSVAAFVPDDDADRVTRRLLHVCHCMPEMARVSVHFVFPAAHPPYVQEHVGDASHTCALPPTTPDLRTYRVGHRMPYPVNLARNVARTAARTDHILVADVELVPSDNLAGRFKQMLARYAATKRLRHPARVFVLPVFEVEQYEEIPRTKRQLLRLVRDDKAMYFHRHICSHCQKFPGLEDWLQQDALSDDVKPLAVVKREYPFHRWEPIFIGGKDEPLYSEQLSWEGKQDKMTQMLEMCLEGYRFVILDNAFLVHWPGVKRKSDALRTSNKWRYPYLLKNTRQYKNIVSKLAHKYRRNSKCKVQ